MTDQTAKLEWRDGQVPVSTQFDDPYFSLDNGLAETRHVFLGGNDLPARFCDGFHIAELGFGTGLNLLTTMQSWIEVGAPGRLHFTSFEAFPMAATDMEIALAAFPDLADLARPLLALWSSDGRAGDLGHGVWLDVVIGDARETLPNWDGRANAWFLDGFSPAKNPELWEPDLILAVGTHTASGGSAATYSAAGHVRRSLKAAGFDVVREPGYGRKRHMTVARMPS